MSGDLDALHIGERAVNATHDQHLCRECGAWRQPHEMPCPNCGSHGAPVLWKGGGD